MKFGKWENTMTRVLVLNDMKLKITKIFEMYFHKEVHKLKVVYIEKLNQCFPLVSKIPVHEF
jgi:hypothetical protein